MNFRFFSVALLGGLTTLVLSTASIAQTSSTTTLTSSGSDRPSSSVAQNQPIIDKMAKLVCIHKVQIAAQSDGMIKALEVREGDNVTKGDKLIQIDDRVAQAELQVATKELEAAKKQSEQTAEVEYSKKASALADAEYEAERKLFLKNATSKGQAKRVRLEAEKARFGIDVAIVKHQQEILAADVAQEKLKAAEVRLEMFRVTAPFDGVIVQRLRDQGEWIRAGEPVLRLVHMKEMKVEAYVPVAGISIASLQGATMKVTVPINPSHNFEIPTTVEFVSPEIEAGRVRVTSRIQNQRIGSTWLLRDGMRATVEIVPIAE